MEEEPSNSRLADEPARADELACALGWLSIPAPEPAEVGIHCINGHGDPAAENGLADHVPGPPSPVAPSATRSTCSSRPRWMLVDLAPRDADPTRSSPPGFRVPAEPHGSTAIDCGFAIKSASVSRVVFPTPFPAAAETCIGRSTHPVWLPTAGRTPVGVRGGPHGTRYHRPCSPDFFPC